MHTKRARFSVPKLSPWLGWGRESMAALFWGRESMAALFWGRESMAALFWGRGLKSLGTLELEDYVLTPRL